VLGTYLSTASKGETGRLTMPTVNCSEAAFDVEGSPVGVTMVREENSISRSLQSESQEINDRAWDGECVVVVVGREP
jgi:hypothetical protein